MASSTASPSCRCACRLSSSNRASRGGPPVEIVLIRPFFNRRCPRYSFGVAMPPTPKMRCPEDKLVAIHRRPRHTLAQPSRECWRALFDLHFGDPVERLVVSLQGRRLLTHRLFCRTFEELLVGLVEGCPADFYGWHHTW